MKSTTDKLMLKLLVVVIFGYGLAFTIIGTILAGLVLFGYEP